MSLVGLKAKSDALSKSQTKNKYKFVKLKSLFANNSQTFFKRKSLSSLQISNNNKITTCSLYICLLCILLQFACNVTATALKAQNLSNVEANYVTKHFYENKSISTFKPALSLSLDSKQSVELPSFAEPIGNHTVPVGRDAQLACKINNLANFKTAWLRVSDNGILTIHSNVITRNYRVGLKIDDQNTSFVLTIKNVQPSDRGAYMCQVNSKPMRAAVGYLDVLTPPTFVDELQASASAQTSAITSTANDQQQQQQQQQLQQQTTNVISVVEGANATLNCRVVGHPPPLITWRREDRQQIIMQRDGDAELLSKFEGPSLRLTSVTRANAGAYLCIASNGVQPHASKRIVLDVQFSPAVKATSEIVYGQQGKQATLACIVEQNPRGSLSWFKVSGGNSDSDVNSRNAPLPLANSVADGSSSSSSSFATATTSDELLAELTHVSSTNANGAAKIATTDAGDYSKQFASTTHSDKYEIVINSSDQTAAASAQLTLVVRRIDKFDFGAYRCVARNSLGAQSAQLTLVEQSSIIGDHNSLFGAIFSQASSGQQSSDFAPGLGRQRASLSSQVAGGERSQRAYSRNTPRPRAKEGDVDSFANAAQLPSSASSSSSLLNAQVKFVHCSLLLSSLLTSLLLFI